ncbi:hypothetical protein M378DRAFT_168575, partial [Amanita muscaria Koide BX008]
MYPINQLSLTGTARFIKAPEERGQVPLPTSKKSRSRGLLFCNTGAINLSILVLAPQFQEQTDTLSALWIERQQI